MIKLLFIILFLYILGTLILFGVDFYHYLLDTYGRFHIGRFSSEEEWIEKVTKRAVKWLKKEPTVKFTDNNRYILFDMLAGKYRNSTVQSWQKGALILGLQQDENKYKTEIQKCIDSIIDKNGSFIKQPTNIDCGFLSYAILKNSNPIVVKPAMDYAANLILNNIGKDGMIAYTDNKNSTERYVDTIGLSVPFLFAYAKTYNVPNIREIALLQLKLFSEYGLERTSFLPNHAFDTNSKLPLGVYGWGRGCAWYVIGLLDSYLEMDNGTDRNWVKEQIRKVAEKYKLYQKKDGGFSYIIQMENGYDSSVTAVMAYFYKNCSNIFSNESYHKIYENCLKKLRSETKMTGALDWCQGDTKGIGIFSQSFSIMPFAQGMLVRSFKEI